MKAIAVVLLLLEVVSISTSIPLENPSSDSSSKSLTSQVRQKRGGWGYETAWIPSHGPTYISTTPILGASKTIISSPAAIAVAAAPATTTYLVPQRVATAAVSVPTGHHSESFVYQSGPDHTYYVHQRHTPHTTYYYQYPTATHAVLTHPTTHYIAGAPVFATTWP